MAFLWITEIQNYTRHPFKIRMKTGANWGTIARESEKGAPSKTPLPLNDGKWHEIAADALYHVTDMAIPWTDGFMQIARHEKATSGVRIYSSEINYKNKNGNYIIFDLMKPEHGVTQLAQSAPVEGNPSYKLELLDDRIDITMTHFTNTFHQVYLLYKDAYEETKKWSEIAAEVMGPELEE